MRIRLTTSWRFDFHFHACRGHLSFCLAMRCLPLFEFFAGNYFTILFAIVWNYYKTFSNSIWLCFKTTLKVEASSFHWDWQPPSHGIVDLLSQTILSKRCPTSRHTLGTSLWDWGLNSSTVLRCRSILRLWEVSLRRRARLSCWGGWSRMFKAIFIRASMASMQPGIM